MKYVYLVNMENTDFYKIGFTKNSPEKRVKNLQTGNPKNINLVDSYRSNIAQNIETALHNFLRHKKIDSHEGVKLMGEWFLLDREDVKQFQEKCKTIETNLNVIKEGGDFF